MPQNATFQPALKPACVIIKFAFFTFWQRPFRPKITLITSFSALLKCPFRTFSCYLSTKTVLPSSLPTLVWLSSGPLFALSWYISQQKNMQSLPWHNSIYASSEWLCAQCEVEVMNSSGKPLAWEQSVKVIRILHDCLSVSFICRIFVKQTAYLLINNYLRLRMVCAIYC